MADRLPEFVPPMLAKIGQPFDSEEHIFEIKWDGTRGMCAVEADGFRLLNRKQRPMFVRYPELDFGLQLPPGTIVDGEVVVFVDGEPQFAGMLKREQAHDPIRVRKLARSMPATYVAFDLLYLDYEPLVDLTLLQRRERLAELLSSVEHSRLVFSDGVVGRGIDYFTQASEQGLEGVMAKRLASRYLPGKRSDSWLKIKQARHIYCAIIGFLADGQDDLKSLVIATEFDGELSCVGRVGSGLTEAMRLQLRAVLDQRVRDSPLVEAEGPAVWVEPGLYCTVKYLERTANGELRAPVFVELISDDGDS